MKEQGIWHDSELVKRNAGHLSTMLKLPELVAENLGRYSKGFEDVLNFVGSLSLRQATERAVITDFNYANTQAVEEILAVVDLIQRHKA